MIPSFSKMHLSLLAAGGALLLQTAPLGAVTLIEDQFTGAAGSNIAGTTPSVVGSPTQWTVWSSSPLQTAYITSPIAGAASLAGSAGQSAGNVISIGSIASYPAVSVSADITLGSGATGFGGINLAGDASSPFGLVLALIDQNGGVSLYKNYAGSNLGGGSIADFSLTQSYNLSLVYDPTSGIANVYVDGNVVISNVAVGALSDTISKAGFIGYEGGVPNGTLDNFVVATVPEPGSFALAGIGAFGILALRRRAVSKC